MWACTAFHYTERMPMNVELVFFQFLVLIFSLSVHECSHAWMAWRLGDATAFMLGRVTLNPLKQLTLIGSVLFPLIGLFFGVPLIGWAKPTPVTTRNFKNYKRDDIMVTMAGPFSNIGLAVLALILLVVVKHIGNGIVLVATAEAVAYNYPLADTTGLSAAFPLVLLLYFGILFNVGLFLFNLIPLPPLDGSHLLKHVLPYQWQDQFQNAGMFGMLFLYFVVGRLHLLNAVYFPVLGVFDRLLERL